MNNKDSQIILCSGIKMDRNYENVLSYTEEAMVSLCQNNSIYTGFNYRIIEPNKTIDIEAKYKDCIYANYMAFINPSYGHKWMFAWVTNVEFRNPATTRITFKIDVFSTWFGRFNLNPVFVEREHVSDDTVGKHTLPENVELGEYITQTSNNSTVVDNVTALNYLASYYLIAGVSELGIPVTLPANSDKIYSGIPSGLRYLVFEDGENLDYYIRNVEHNRAGDVIYSVFIVPSDMITLGQSDWIDVSSSSDIPYAFKFAFVPDSTGETDMGGIAIGKATFLDSDYVPVNKKLLTFPYCFLNITNNVGITKDYHYELFNGSTCTFDLLGAIGVGCSIKLCPTDYAFKGTTTTTVDNKLHSIDAGKLPTCSWISDSYTNWLTANSVNIGLSAVKDFAYIGAGAVTGNVSGIAGGFMGIAGTVANVYEHALQPASAKGGTNQGDLIFARKMTFNVYKMSIKKENATIIDQYFSRFGYKVNEVKTPSLTSRTKFNFIKVGGLDELVTGNIPSTDLEEINRIFRKGVTIFHNYSDFGNYTISNPIVS